MNERAAHHFMSHSRGFHDAMEKKALKCILLKAHKNLNHFENGHESLS